MGKVQMGDLGADRTKLFKWILKK